MRTSTPSPSARTALPPGDAAAVAAHIRRCIERSTGLVNVVELFREINGERTGNGSSVDNQRRIADIIHRGSGGQEI